MISGASMRTAGRFRLENVWRRGLWVQFEDVYGLGSGFRA